MSSQLEKLVPNCFNYTMRFLGEPIPYRQDPKIHYTGTLFTKESQKALAKAHVCAETLISLCKISHLSKAFNTALAKPKNLLEDEIHMHIDRIRHASFGPSYRLSDLVYSGCYLKVLSVYFKRNPKALENDYLHTGRTLMHSAVETQTYAARSFPFIQFLLSLDAQHNLGLLYKRGGAGGIIPLHCVRPFGPLVYGTPPEAHSQAQRIMETFREHMEKYPDVHAAPAVPIPILSMPPPEALVLDLPPLAPLSVFGDMIHPEDSAEEPPAASPRAQASCLEKLWLLVLGIWQWLVSYFGRI